MIHLVFMLNANETSQNQFRSFEWFEKSMVTLKYVAYGLKLLEDFKACKVNSFLNKLKCL